MTMFIEVGFRIELGCASPGLSNTGSCRCPMGLEVQCGRIHAPFFEPHRPES
jgi:hypothetical protein